MTTLLDRFAADPARYLAETGILHVRKLPTGELAGVQRMMFTWGLMVGLDHAGYRTRFCYESCADAVAALESWDGSGWPPGYWVKQKPEDIHGPGSKDRFAEKTHDRLNPHPVKVGG
jgi:hypothetical protein